MLPAIALVTSKSVNQPLVTLVPVAPMLVTNKSFQRTVELPRLSVLVVSEIRDVFIATLARLSKAVEAPPAEGSVQLKFPLPSVFNNWLASPSVVGRVRVCVPAASATFKVTVPLVVPLNSIEPVAVPATPTVSF